MSVATGGSSAATYHFTLAELLTVLSSIVVERGLAIAARRGVHAYQASPDGGRINATVVNEQGYAYHPNILLSRASGRLTVKGYCTCPVGVNCKHVAAVLLERAKQFDPAASGLAATSARPGLPMAVSRQQYAARPQPALESAAPLKHGAPDLAIGLSSAARAWLERLTAAGAEPVPRLMTATTRSLRYVLDVKTTKGPGFAWVRPVTVVLTREGAVRDLREIQPRDAERLHRQGTKYMTDADVSIMRALSWLIQESQGYAAYAQLNADAASLGVIGKMLATGRLHLDSADGPVLAAGPRRAAEPRWVRNASAQQQLVLAASDGAPFDTVLALDPPHYIARSEALIGQIETAMPAEIALEIARAPMIGPREAALVREALGRGARPQTTAPTHDAETGEIPAEPARGLAMLPLPDASLRVKTRVVVPTPQLHLYQAAVRVKQRFSWYVQLPEHKVAFKAPLARLSFDYDGETVADGTPDGVLERLEGDTLMIIPRDLVAEQKAARTLARMDLVTLAQSHLEAVGDDHRAWFAAPDADLDHYGAMDDLLNPQRFIELSAETVPALRNSGWTVTFADDYPYRIADGKAEWWAETGEGSGIDWFAFELGIIFEGTRINIVQQLVSVLQRLPPEIVALARKPETTAAFEAALAKVQLYVSLPDGRMLPLPGDRLTPVLQGLIELIGPRTEQVKDGKIKLHRAEAGALATLAGTLKDVAWAVNTEKLIALGNSLKRGRNLVPVAPPKSFKAKLRPYQADGLAWLDFLREAGFGGVLADDMGLGKTVQALAFLAREKTAGRLDKPALILAPTSVLPNWQSEAQRFAPKLSVLALRGADRHALFEQIPKSDIVLTTYPLLARDFEVLLKQEFHLAILDEAQAIKNPKATITGLAHRINARHRIALTGTPLENNLGEVWSLFEFLSPGLLGDEAAFRRTFRTPIEKHGDQAAQAFLSRRLKPFLLRRTKQEVATELPPKTEIVERIQLEGSQRDLYETVRIVMEKRVRDEISKKGLAKSHIIFLDALLKLRQVCCDPRLLKMEQARKVKQSAKLDRLMALVPEMVAEGRKILLFSQFTSMLELIEIELNARKIGYVKLTGQTDDRSVPVKAFQAGEVPIFLLSLKAGGTGLNLTAADTVIHYDPWWNPAVENQATDRAYRIGQDKPVFVYKLIVDDGIEEAIGLLKAKKAALADALFAGTSQASMQLTEADIAALFAPLSGKPALRKAA